MKSALPFVVMVMLLVPAEYLYGQETPKEQEEEEEVVIEPRRYANRGRDRIIVDINTDQWVENLPGVGLKTWSPGVNIYYMADYIFLNSAFSMAVGFGLGSANFRTNAHPTTIVDNNTNMESTALVPFPTGFSYSRNKMSANYLEVPVELRLRTRRRTTWRLYGGFKGGYLVNFHTKRKDDTGKYKEYNTKFIRKYRFGPHARVGIGKFNFTAFYSLTPFFEDEKGPVLTPFSLGFSIYVL